jgi:hypothetical protein
VCNYYVITSDKLDAYSRIKCQVQRWSKVSYKKKGTSKGE